MGRFKRSFAVCAAVLLSVVLLVPTAVASPAAGEVALDYTRQLSLTSRVAGTASELNGAAMIAGWLDDAGYVVEVQPFTFQRKGKTRYSQNVVATLPATVGEGPRPLVILGAHYDSVVAGNGADDNGSGVGCLMEIAEAVAAYERDYDVVFIAFGAEEVGLEGSFYYAGELSQADKDRTVAMINFDSLIAGDKAYIHAGTNEKVAPRDAMLAIIGDQGLEIETQPGLNAEYPAGLTPDWFSDYTAFNQAGIPIVAFESTNWEIGDLDGYQQTVRFGSFWHTGKDKLKTIQRRFPGRPLAHLADYSTLVETYLMDPVP